MPVSERLSEIENGIKNLIIKYKIYASFNGSRSELVEAIHFDITNKLCPLCRLANDNCLIDGELCPGKPCGEFLVERSSFLVGSSSMETFKQVCIERIKYYENVQKRRIKK